MLKRQLPNILTVLRMALTVPAAVALFHREYPLALAVFAVAGLSDAIDGFLARRFDWMTHLGALIDPLADKILLITTFCVLAYTDQLPMFVLMVILLRDLVILSGALAYQFLFGGLKGQPSLLGKSCTLIQILYAIALIYSLEPFLPIVISAKQMSWFSVLVIVSSLLSGGHYVWVWAYKARDQLLLKRKTYCNQ